MSNSKVEAAGYVIFADGTIFGAGFNEEDCAADARQWVDNADEVPDEAQIFLGEIKEAKMKGKLIMVEATKALVESVVEFGAPDRWSMVGTIAVTDEESE